MICSVGSSLPRTEKEVNEQKPIHRNDLCSMRRGIIPNLFLTALMVPSLQGLVSGAGPKTREYGGRMDGFVINTLWPSFTDSIS